MNDKAQRDLEWALNYNKKYAQLAPKEVEISEAEYMTRRQNAEKVLKAANFLLDCLDGMGIDEALNKHA